MLLCIPGSSSVAIARSRLDESDEYEKEVPGELLEFEFMDEDEMGRELDDNWISEDDILYDQIVAMKKQAWQQLQQTGGFFHPPRVLHRIEEEKSEKSSSEGSEEGRAACPASTRDQQVAGAPTKLVGYLEDSNEFSRLQVKFKYSKDGGIRDQSSPQLSVMGFFGCIKNLSNFIFNS